MNGTNFTHELFDTAKYYLGIWFCVSTIIGCPINLFAAKCAWKFARQRNPALLYQWFVLSMSTADFLFLLVVSPWFFLDFAFKIHLPKFFCLSIYCINYCSTVASSLSLLALNFDKFLAIYFPLRHVSILNGRKVFLIILSSWIVSILWGLCFVLSPITVCSERGLKVESLVYYLAFAIIFFLIPTVTAAVLSFLIAIVLLRQWDQFFVRLPSDSLERLSQTSRRNRSPSNALEGNRRYSRAKAITFVFTTTIWSTLTCLPYRTFYLIIEYTKLETNPSPSPLLWLSTLFFLGGFVANPVGNAFITIITQKRYRNEVRLVKEKLRDFVFGRRPEID